MIFWRVWKSLELFKKGSRRFLEDSKKSRRVLEIIQTGNEIISPTSRPLIKKIILQNISHLFQSVQN